LKTAAGRPTIRRCAQTTPDLQSAFGLASFKPVISVQGKHLDRSESRPPEPGLFTRNFILVSLASTVNGGSFQLLLAVLPLYVLELGGRETEVGLLFSVMSLAALLVRPLVAWAVEAYGRKRLMLIGPVAYITAGLGYLLVTTIPLLMGLRAYHGVGMAAYSTGAMVFVADQAPPRRRGEAMGYFGMSFNLSQAAGPALGLALLAVIGFHGLFLCSAGLSVLALALTMLLVDNFVPRNRPPFRLSAMVSRKALRPLLLVLAQASAMGAIMSFVPLYGRSQGVDNPGLFFTVYALATIAARPTSGAISDRLGRMATIVPGMTVMASGLWLLAYSGQFWYLVASAVLIGAGSGTVFPSLMALVLDVTGSHERGAAVSTFNIGMDLGFGIGSVALGMVIERAGYSAAFILSGAVLLVMLCLYGLSGRIPPGGRLPLANSR